MERCKRAFEYTEKAEVLIVRLQHIIALMFPEFSKRKKKVKFFRENGNQTTGSQWQFE